MNLANPASLSDLKFVTVDFNAVSNTIFSKDASGANGMVNDGSLGSVAIGVPLLKNWGAMLGMTPYSSMGYQYRIQGSDNFGNDYTDQYKGSGGLNNLFFATGYRYKNLSIGAKSNYIFGVVSHEKLRAFSSKNNFNVFEEKQYGIYDFAFDFSAQYKLNLNDNLQFVVGAIYGLQQNLKTKYSVLSKITSVTELNDNLKETVVPNAYAWQVENTIDNPTLTTLTLPVYYGGGLSAKYKDRLVITADYKQQNWRAFQLTNSSNYALSRMIGLDAEYIPNKNSVGMENYHKRIAYRVGLNYNQTPIYINSNNISEYSASIGASFPLKKYKFERELFGTYLNVAVQAGRRGTTQNGLVQEDFIKLNVGFTFNDKWFIKRKFD